MNKYALFAALLALLAPIACSDDSSGNGSDADSDTDSDTDSDADSDADSDTDGDCPVMPADNPWNTPIGDYDVHENSDNYIASIGWDDTLHPDFGTVWDGAPNGIPYVLVTPNTPKVDVEFLYADESDVGPYPIPDDPPIEGGPDGTGDRHILMVDLTDCVLYELFNAWPPGEGDNPYDDVWYAGSGAIFDPGLVRYDEAVEQGEINHALRFTVNQSQAGFIHPATHFASESLDPDLPPMGLRLRLQADYDITGFSTEVQVILEALKTYGMFVADNGSDWFISGAPNTGWSDDNLAELHSVPGSAFEVVDTGEIIN